MTFAPHPTMLDGESVVRATTRSVEVAVMPYTTPPRVVVTDQSGARMLHAATSTVEAIAATITDGMAETRRQPRRWWQ